MTGNEAARIHPVPRVRAAEAADAAAVIGVFLRARAAMDYLPRLHSGEETAEHFTHHVLAHSQVWVAESGGRVLGFAAVEGNDLAHLYVDPLAQRQGIGGQLLTAATAGREWLELWVFQRNQGARAFYERHGWRLRYETDGRDNEERAPDARYRWITPDPGAVSAGTAGAGSHSDSAGAGSGSAGAGSAGAAPGRPGGTPGTL